MKLEQFRVRNFRSVEDSGWVSVEAVTALIGVNESGKTNLLLPLWKLNPARDGEIEPTSDYPKIKFGEIRDAPARYYFIEADFSAGEAAPVIAEAASLTEADVAVVRVTRFYNGSYYVEFPRHDRPTSVDATELRVKLEGYRESIEQAKALKPEADLQKGLVEEIRAVLGTLSECEAVAAPTLRQIGERISSLVPTEPAKTSAIVPLVEQLRAELSEEINRITAPDPGRSEEVIETVRAAMPKFVYYSNYGNLDSERHCCTTSWLVLV